MRASSFGGRARSVSEDRLSGAALDPLRHAHECRHRAVGARNLNVEFFHLPRPPERLHPTLHHGVPAVRQDVKSIEITNLDSLGAPLRYRKMTERNKGTKGAC